jgi:acetolactate synthase-1/2/3 large subunit
MDAFLAHKGPVLLEACVSKMEHVYPMVAAGCALDEMKLHPDLRHLLESEPDGA